jgi:quinol monooxygenase YgiN
MIVIHGTIRIPAENMADARPVMKALVDATRKEDGCIAYTFGEVVGDPGLILIAETWRDQAAVGAHFNAPHFVAWREANAELGVTDRQLTVFETTSAKAL